MEVVRQRPCPSSQGAAPVLGLVWWMLWRQEVGWWEPIDVGFSRDVEGGARASVFPVASPAQRNTLFLLFLHKIPESVHRKMTAPKLPSLRPSKAVP